MGNTTHKRIGFNDELRNSQISKFGFVKYVPIKAHYGNKKVFIICAHKKKLWIISFAKKRSWKQVMDYILKIKVQYWYNETKQSSGESILNSYDKGLSNNKFIEVYKFQSTICYDNKLVYLSNINIRQLSWKKFMGGPSYEIIGYKNYLK